jgi:coenzyme F420-dependent glucose-6-phosphate dehydrogenase
MAKFGYTLSCEEHPPARLVEHARRAEEAGFDFAMISDHFHPWTDTQGESPFVWGVLGAVAQATERLRFGTGVTCPLVRIHPAIVAQAAATIAALMPRRFFLGVGTGENLNEHITGERWPPLGVRREMLEEAVEVIRLLWQGGLRSHRGPHYTVENARIYTLPEAPPPIMVAAAGPEAATLAGRIGDGLVGIAPDPEIVDAFARAGGAGKPRIAQVHVCFGEDEAEARRIAFEQWPNVALTGQLGQELPLPAHFEQAVAPLREEDVAEKVVCGPDASAHIAQIREYLDAGFDHVYMHQIGLDQEGFFRFYEQEVLPELARQPVRA